MGGLTQEMLDARTLEGDGFIGVQGLLVAESLVEKGLIAKCLKDGIYDVYYGTQRNMQGYTHFECINLFDEDDIAVEDDDRIFTEENMDELEIKEWREQCFVDRLFDYISMHGAECIFGRPTNFNLRLPE